MSTFRMRGFATNAFATSAPPGRTVSTPGGTKPKEKRKENQLNVFPLGSRGVYIVCWNLRPTSTASLANSRTVIGASLGFKGGKDGHVILKKKKTLKE